MDRAKSSSLDRATAFIREVFRQRGYRLKRPDYERIFYEPENLWEILTVDESGRKVLAVFANNTEEFANNGDHGSQKVTTNFLKSIVSYCEKKQIKVFILVAEVRMHDLIILDQGSFQWTHFTYAETNVGSISRHMYQPIEIVRAEPLGRFDTCQEISDQDILMRVYGFQSGDVIKVVESNRQVGMTTQYFRIVSSRS